MGGPIKENGLALKFKLARFISTLAPPAELADVVQEPYVQLYQAGSSGGFGYRRTGLLDRLRGSSARRNTMPTGGTGSGKPAAESTGNEQLSHLCAVVRELPAQQRRVLLLKKVYGRTQAEIAAVLKMSEANVVMHVATAIRHCSTSLLGQPPIGKETSGSAREESAENVIQLRSPARRASEACDWVARVDRGLSEDEAVKFRRWMALDDENATVVQETAVIWDELDMLHRLAEMFPFPDYRPPSPTLQWLSTAATISAIVLACITGIWVAMLTSQG